MVYLILVFFLEILFIIGMMTVLIIGQSVPTALREKKPVKHWFSMLRAIFTIAPYKATARLSWALLTGVVVFTMLINGLEKDGQSIFAIPILAEIAIVLTSLNMFFVIFSAFAILTGKKKKANEGGWQMIRPKAHKKIYGAWPNHGKYGTFLEGFLKS